MTPKDINTIIFALLSVMFIIDTVLSLQVIRLTTKIKKLEADDEENSSSNNSVND